MKRTYRRLHLFDVLTGLAGRTAHRAPVSRSARTTLLGCCSWRRLSWQLVSFVLAGCSGRACEPPPRATAEVPRVAPVQAEGQPLQAKLAQALKAKGPSYVPRTRHTNADGSPRYTNRLILESSPYLLQHAHNPVDWFPWGDEAFEVAKRLHRPVFLSVGYSTCHWCHVMEEESFEDEAVAAYLNKHYVCIKVDREERPDIDATYMSFVQALTGRGGWPMSVWLTPSKEPFFGGTYFPPHAGVHGARMGLVEIARAQAERFAADPSAVAAQATRFTERMQALKETLPQPAGDLPGAPLLTRAVQTAAARFDPEMGGTRGAPKFPSSFPLDLLLRAARRGAPGDPLHMAVVTLDHMHAGGIYDHLGGGFHRYSTDAQWRVPHFEKMLYDNALLARTYLHAGQLAGNAQYTRVAREILDYLLREMRGADGTFCAATDADSLTSDGRLEEGAYFTWTPAELAGVLSKDDAAIARAWFAVTDKGDLDGRSVLRTEREPRAVAAEFSLTPAELAARIQNIRRVLLRARAERSPPLRDDKAIIAWNALAVSALAHAARVLADQRYEEAALRCATALIAEHRARRPLPHLIIGGRPSGRAFGDDVAHLSAALLDVFELTGDVQWLRDSQSLMDMLERDFVDGKIGGYFLSSTGQERLLLRDKPDRDGPLPSVNSVAALTWLRLYTFTDRAVYRERADAIIRAFSQTLERQPLALDHMLDAVDWATDASKEVAIVVPSGAGALAVDARPLLDVLSSTYVPNSAWVVGPQAAVQTATGALGERVPWVRDKVLHAGHATAYVCERGTCQLPTSDPAVFAEQLRATTPYH